LKCAFGLSFVCVVLISGCKTAPTKPTVELTSKSGGLIVHARVGDAPNNYVKHFEICESKNRQKCALKYDGNKPMRAMLLAVHAGENTDVIHDEADGFDQFLLEPPGTATFWILADHEYTATACNSNGDCSSANFTIFSSARS
jgi:hypothetical protein